MIRRTCLALAAAFVAGLPLQAQRSGPTAYPNVDKPLEVAPGETIHLLSRIMHEAGPAMSRPGKRLDFVYATRIPSSNRAERAAQADRVAQVLGEQAIELGVHHMSVGICDTRECAERKHPPSEWFLYRRTHTGWRRVP